MTARGTAFEDKEVGANAPSARYRYGYRYGWVSLVAAWVMEGWV